MKRSEQLLRAAAKALNSQMDPFSTNFLVENAVTLDECGSMSESIGVAILAWLELPPRARAAELFAQRLRAGESSK